MINCNTCGTEFKTKVPLVMPSYTQIFESNGNTSAGAYLILEKDENSDGGKYPIKLDISQVGRQSIQKNVDIPFDTSDRRMSRLHFTIVKESKGEGKYRFIISARPNTNGTFLNEKELQENEEIYLCDNDVIRAGQSKIIFKVIG